MTTMDPSASEPDNGDESAGAKLWAVYISEAEKYDRALVEGWKSDMDGLLIFAGLFSAILTAFLIESYKSLTPDQAAITITLLAQISRQLDASLNATSLDLSTLTTFRPTSSSIACNTFWFLSLGFSLTCAFIAILVEQWARDFIQKTEMRPSPVIRARIYSYLYHGLQRFGMHTTVTCLPLLLHASLLLFFAGLVAFLQPVNTLLMTIVALLLGAISATYICLTVLPILFSDSPYRTPLSSVVWACFLRLRTAFRQGVLLDAESTISPHGSATAPEKLPTMIEAMTRDAVRKSHKRDERDARALAWTVESLTDNEELELFVKALPELILGRQAYNGIINALIENREIQLVSRIEGLLRSCDSGLLRPELATRRQISCIKALRSIADFAASDASTRHFFPRFDHSTLDPERSDVEPRVTGHLTSAYCVVRWCGYCAVIQVVRDGISMLNAIGTTTPVQDPRVILQLVRERAEEYGYKEFGRVLSSLVTLPSDDLSLIRRSQDALVSFEDCAYDILLEYLRNCALLDDFPPVFEATCMKVQPIAAQPNTVALTRLKDTLISILSEQDDSFWECEEVHHIDITIDIVLSLLQVNVGSMDAALSEALATYLINRSNEGIGRALCRCSPEFIGGLLTKYLGQLRQDHLRVLEQIWTFCLDPDSQMAVFDHTTIAVIAAAPQFAISSCVVTVLKSHILRRSTELSPAQLASLLDTLEIPPSSSADTLEQWAEADFAILVEFLEHYSALPVSELNKWLQTQTRDTFNYLAPSSPRAAPPQQRRFADWLLRFLNRRSPANAVSQSSMISEILEWENLSPGNFDDSTARSTIHKALTTYVGSLSDGDRKSYWPRRRIQILLALFTPFVGPGTDLAPTRCTVR